MRAVAGDPNDLVLGVLDGEEVTLGDLASALRRIAALPRPVPVEDRISDDDWAEAVVMRGEAPYGRCDYCKAALGKAGCLNLCDMPAGAAREFNAGLLAVIAERRSRVHFLEVLGDCSCPSPSLSGYQVERESHHRGCPMERS